MNKKSVENVLKELVQETLQGFRTWQPISSRTIQKNPALCATLSENEFHRIRLEKSYYLPFQQGFFFLVDEWIESGRDGTTFDGLILYVQTNIDNDLFEVARDSEYLYRLMNIISEKCDFPKDIGDFLDAFLNS